jgi:CRP-like cAMP-binding protein
MLFIDLVDLKKGDFLYNKGDIADKFYFVVTGQLEILVKSESNDDFKFSKGIDKSSFFGLKKNYQEERTDYARVTTEIAEILVFDS